MAPNAPRFCPRCGAPVGIGRRVCANCGLDIPSRTISQDFPAVPRASAPSPQESVGVPDRYTLQSSPSPFSASKRPGTSGPVRPASKSRRGRVGLVIALLVVALLGIGGYFLAALLGVQFPGMTNSQPAVTTSNINETVTYAGVSITILNAQQSQRFVNDPDSGNDGMLRLNLREQNSADMTIDLPYANIARLVLPGGLTVAPTYVKAKGSIAAGVTQNSFVDFAVPTTTAVRKVILRLGAASEAQMDIPLSSQANLSKYAPHSVKPDGQMLYMGLNWTLTQATSQLYIDGQQASKGKRYIIVTLSVDNTLSQEAITGSPYSYIRLQVGKTLLSPQATTLPVSFATGETGKTGTVTFLAPQNSSAFTLILQPQGSNSGFDPASTDFQLS